MDQTALELSGYGYGDGDGDGYGSGYGYGYGSGSGYGDGSGSGSGDGYGDGYGDGSKIYFDALLAPYARNPKTVLAFWRSHLNGTPANGGTGKPVKVGDVQEIAGPLRMCSEYALHATLNPSKWEGGRWWVVELHEPVAREDDKLGSLKRRIVADLGKCPFG